MKRTRKYRVWDIIHEVFLPTDVYALITTDFGAFGIMIKGWHNYREGEYFYPDSQIQSDFTGLHDKNGKEIYEGDLHKDETGVTLCVVWDQNEARFAWVEMEDGEVVCGSIICMDENDEAEEVTIIGNIYENPELLK